MEDKRTKTLLNLDGLTYPPLFAKALALSDEAAKLMGKEGDPVGMSQAREAIRLLAESNRLMVRILTDGKMT